MSQNNLQGNYIQFNPLYTSFISRLRNDKVFDDTIINIFVQDKVAIASCDQDETVILIEDPVTRTIVTEKQTEIERIIQNLTSSESTVSIYNPNEYEQVLTLRHNLNNPDAVNTQQEIQLGIQIPKDYTFDSFVVGECNRECHAAALACAYSPGKFYNPLFIYGNSGLGKSHLMCSIGNYVRDKYPDKKVCYMPTMDFVEAVSDSIRKGNIDQFKRELKTYDVLLMDDIQFLANKDKSHEIFFSCYNELINNNKQIVVVSDRLPGEIKGIEERLITRFKQGLTVGIDSPEFETALAILKKKLSISSNEFKTDIDEETLAFLATNFNSDVRSLEGSLKRLQFLIIQNNPPVPVNVDFAVSCFKDKNVVLTKDGLTPKKIINTVADYYNLSRKQITSKTRTKEVSTARQVSMYFIRKLLDLPYLQIGAEFGGKDHSTVFTSISKVEKLIKTDEYFADSMEKLEKMLKPQN